jgi:hypothetical protein
VSNDLKQETGAQTLPPETLICQVDHIAMHPHGMFGYGWALDRAGTIAHATLQLHYEDGTTESVKASMNRVREEVAIAFPHHAQAAHSGFMLMAGWSGLPPQKIELVFELTDGRVKRTNLANAASGGNVQARFSKSLYLFKRAWAYVRQGRIRHLIHKAARYGRSNPRLGTADDDTLASRLRGRRCRLVIDHSMGGGANLFRERLVSQWLKEGDTVALLSFKVASMEAFVEVQDSRGSLVSTLSQWETLSAVLEEADLAQIFFNCAVSFPNPGRLQKLVLDIKRRTHAELTVAMHDYFLVCPSNFLLDSTGTYCGVPSVDQCESCLPYHQDGFVSLTGERSILDWRTLWTQLLEAADEVRCFSESTRRLLKRAYPDIAARSTLRPHDVTPLRAIRNSRLENPVLTIGVIGAISHHKGAAVIADLAKAISASGAPVKIVVIGSVDAWCPPEIVTQTGPYKQEDLPKIVEKHHINIALMPSICPETFSFVAHEIISMKLPLVSLDLGAQADLVRSQATGHVSCRHDGPGLLEELIAFDRQLHPLTLKVLS